MTGILLMLPGCENSQKPPVTLTLHITDPGMACDQWVYWFCLSGNEYSIQDSCFIPEGATRVSMESVLHGDDLSYYWLTFSKEGPDQALLYLSPGEKVTIEVSSDMPWIPRTTGSPATEELLKYSTTQHSAVHRLEELEEAFYITEDQEQIKAIGDSLDRYGEWVTYQGGLEFLRSAEQLQSYFTVFMGIEPYLPQHQADSLLREMRKRFSYSKALRDFPNNRYPPETRSSRDALLKLEDILFEKYGQDPLVESIEEF